MLGSTGATGEELPVEAVIKTDAKPPGLYRPALSLLLVFVHYMLPEVSGPMSLQSPILYRKIAVSNNYMPELYDPQPHYLHLSIFMMVF